jgi:hypothetical protein
MWQIQSPRMQLILTLSGIHWQGEMYKSSIPP